MRHKVYLFGYPLEHSLSPEVNNSFFESHNLPITYEALPIPPENFKHDVLGIMRSDSFLGANVTIPYKEEIVPFLDALAGSASKIQAVNTIVRQRNGKLIGYNTDESAVADVLCANGKSQVESATIIGTGGSARAIIYALARLKCSKLRVLFRSQKRLAGISKLLESLNIKGTFVALSQIEKFFAWAEKKDYLPTNPYNAIYSGFTEKTWEQWKAGGVSGKNDNCVKKFALLVNATPVGMFPNTDSAVIEHPQFFKFFEVVLDLVYNPKVTKFLLASELSGCKTISGFEVFLRQAELSRKLWLKELGYEC